VLGIILHIHRQMSLDVAVDSVVTKLTNDITSAATVSSAQALGENFYG